MKYPVTMIGENDQVVKFFSENHGVVVKKGNNLTTMKVGTESLNYISCSSRYWKPYNAVYLGGE